MYNLFANLWRMGRINADHLTAAVQRGLLSEAQADEILAIER